MQSLPIDPYLQNITELVKNQSQVILTATPGAGKTTRLPYHLLDSVDGKIAVLQTRRLAAISACKYIAKEKNWTEGKEVGYQVRLDGRYEKDTRLLFMTDAILLRRLIDDPELKEFDLIVIDEFHERNLNQDVILGLIKELQEMGSSIKLLIMSATLDLTELKGFLPESEVIDIPGKVFPLDVKYSNQGLKPQTDFEFIKNVTQAVIEADQKTENDILVFLPGLKEITNTQSALMSSGLNRTIQILHGSLSIELQQQVLSHSSQKRVILSTNIAEASVTVPNVNYVIDSGLARVLTTNLNSGFSRLEVSSIAKFNADQRAGRAARQQAGVCHRLWTTFDQQSLETQMLPEVQRSDLSSVLLLLSYLGVRDFKSFSWLSSPSKALVHFAQFYLQSIKAFNEDNSLTDLGQKLLQYPTEPRWGSILSEAEHFGGTDLATSVVAILQNEGGKDNLHSSDGGEESDLLSKMNEFHSVIKPSSYSKGKSFKSGFGKIIENKTQLEKTVTSKKTSALLIDVLDDFLLKTQIDRICRRRQKSDRAVMVGRRGVKLTQESKVKNSEFFIALQGRDFKGQPETMVSMAHGFDKQTLLSVLEDKIKMNETLIYDENKDQFYLKKVRCLYDLEIEEPSLIPAKPADIQDRFTDVLIQRWPFIVENNSKLKNWIARWTYFVNQSEISSDVLESENIKQVLESASVGVKKINEVVALDLTYFFEMNIPKDILNSFQQTVPSHFKAPSEKTHVIHYQEGEAPYVEIKIQELFGLTKHPRLGPKQSPLVFKLLAPNYRPIQVTSDIEGFWKGSYFDVRKDLRGRYPKHPWPEDPLTALPVKKGIRGT